MARPTDYDPEYCERVVELGREGESVVGIAADLGVSKQTVYNWQEKHPEFLDAMTRARDLSESWWASQGKKGIWSREFNASAYRLQMMNRFGWGERSQNEHYGPGGGSIPHEMQVKLVRPDGDD